MRAFRSQGDTEHLTALGFSPGVLYCTQSATLRAGELLRHGRLVVRGDYPTVDNECKAVLIMNVYKSGQVRKDANWQITTQWGQTFDGNDLLGVVAEARLVGFSPNLVRTPVRLPNMLQVRIFAYVPQLGQPEISCDTVCEGIMIQKLGSAPVAENPELFYRADNMNIVG